MRWKEFVVMPAVVIAIGAMWIVWEAKRTKSEQEESFHVPISDDSQVYADFMRELHTDLQFRRSTENWHYERAYASMSEAAERLRELIPPSEELPRFAVMCDLYYRAEKSVSLDGLTSDEANAVIDEFDTYMSREDAIPKHMDDRRMLSGTLSYMLIMLERQGTSQESMLAYATRMEAKIEKCDAPAFKDSATKTLAGFRNRIGLLGKPYRLTGQTLGGVSLDSANFHGKVVLIEFWSTTCGPCISEMPMLRSIYDRHHEAELKIVGVSRDRSKRKLKEFIEDRQIPWSQLWVDHEVGNLDLFESLGVNQVPYSILLDQDGVVVAFDVRAESNGKSLEDWVSQLSSSTR